MDKKKIGKKFLLVILSILLILTVIFAIITNVKKENIAETGLTDDIAKLVNVSYTYKDTSYTSYKTLTADNIIKTAAKYLGDAYDNGVGNGKLYRDAYTDYGSTANNMQNKGTELNKLGTPDCSGLVYATLRQLNVKLSGFDDYSGSAGKQLGPVPLNTYGWVQRNWNDMSKSQAYNIKWADGSSIKRIVDYQTKGTTVNGKEMNSYADFININNIAKGSIIVALNPNTNGENHMWIYIGQYNSADAVKSYLHSIGITDKDSYIYVSGTGTYWSIECNGSQGVVITNRDPAAKYGNKAGSGYAAFTLVDTQTKDVTINIDKEDMDGHDLSGASFSYWNQGTTLTYPPSGSAQGTGTSFTIKNMKYNTYQYVWIQETKAPNVYDIGLKNPIALKVSVSSSGAVSVEKVHDGRNGENIGKYYGGATVNGNTVTVKIKDPKSSKDVPIKILKTTEEGHSSDGAQIKYWVFDNSTDRPTGKTATATKETASGKCIYTINMNYGTTKYVWITETKSNEYSDLGYFDTPDNKTNYIALKVSVDNSGNIKISPLANNNYLVALYTNIPGIISDGTSKYVKTSDIKVNNGTVEVPIINPEKKYEYNLYIGKKSNKDAATISKDNLIGGATFNIRSGRQTGAHTTKEVLYGTEEIFDNRNRINYY